MRAHRFMLLSAVLLASPALGQAPGAGADRLEAASASLGRMKAALKQVLGRAEQARSEKDVVKLNCVNEKLTQIKSLIKVAEQADLALHESVANKDGAGATEVSKIAIARTKVDALRADSERCVGQLAYMVDEKTTIEVEQSPGLPPTTNRGLGVARRGENPGDVLGGLDVRTDSGAPPSAPTFTPPPIIRPPAASPYR